MNNKNQEYRLVNWIDGMAVDSSHFVQLENYFIDALCQSQSLGINRFSYGLLPSKNSENSVNDIEISEKITNHVEIELKKCNAITAEGFRIAYNSQDGNYLSHIHNFEQNQEDGQQKTQWWDVVLTANPFVRIPIGAPDPDATPPRHPDVVTSYKLDIVPTGDMNASSLGRYHLIIGRVRQRSGRFEVDTDFIPPCTSMLSHESLKRYHGEFERFIDDIESSSKKIIAKVTNRLQNAPLALHIKMVCEQIINYISTIYFRFRNVGLEEKPIVIVDYLASLAHRIYVSILFLNKSDKEEMLKYFYEWSDVTPGSFEEIIANALHLKYEHNNLNTIMLQLKSFLTVFTELWLRLSTLEYVGQHKENIVVSQRTSQHETPRSRGGWSVLD